jgi:hypothetical protein
MHADFFALQGRRCAGNGGRHYCHRLQHRERDLRPDRLRRAVALWKALSEGHRTFRRIAVVAPPEAPTPPCGACRQLLWEFAGDVEVILANLDGETDRHRMAELLPQPFDARLLNWEDDRRR